MSAVPPPAAPNSYSLHVEDELGGVFCHSVGDLALLASAKEHARWWIGWARKPARWREKDLSGRPRRLPVGKCRIVVQEYLDPSAAPKPQKRRRNA